ncbi:hypothetical protein V9T40_013232 [Parthenolecanium corni]|uniref:J domain-containing protein n=1 Tax=Parthenolecanium corni TaxID=536013 RepID=A0AAN9Y6R0_9HEMI
MIDYYEILRCSIDASHDQLKSNYKKLILLHHPDKSGESTSDRFHLIQEAWDVLGDSHKRKQFDEELKLFYSYTKNVILYDTVKVDELNHDSDGDYKMCRCGGHYYVTNDLKILLRSLHAVYIPCPFCSFTLKVIE